ncbi:hypothetical protein BLNAU_16331 [Blattamonas nauphoetae]|uniref:Uncharacterized protein n=1 Tax=Blattamonas nauphoetae TaxID=2049346 RepID=A0ABQ9XBQ4_9EUKA|nr:hypothetical protein BLNAU_16331 [Blattamonas nauphoetae]
MGQSESERMTGLDVTIDSTTDYACPNISSESLSSSLGCSPFLNWNEEPLESESEQAVVFWSLVAAVKLQPSLDDSLDVKALKFFKSLKIPNQESADALIFSLASDPDEFSADFVQPIVVFISTASQVIRTAAMEMLARLVVICSAEVRLALVQADLIPQLITTLNPLTISFAEAADIHINLMEIISRSVWLSTPDSLRQLESEDHNKQQAVRYTVLQQILAPSEHNRQEPAKTRTEQHRSLSTINHLTPLFLVSRDFNTTLSLYRSVVPQTHTLPLPSGSPLWLSPPHTRRDVCK